MRTWCVSLTMHGTSKLIIHSSIDPVFVLGSGWSLRHLHISIPWVLHITHSGVTAEPQTLAIPVRAGLHEEAGTHSYSKSKRCPNSECTLRSSVNERSFVIFFFFKSLQHGFQNIFSIKHENIDEWGIITKAMYLYIALHNMFVVQSHYLKHMPGRETTFSGLLHTVTWSWGELNSSCFLWD